MHCCAGTPLWVVVLSVSLAALIPNLHFLESSSGDTSMECLVLDPIAEIFLDYSLANRLPHGLRTRSLVALFPKLDTMKCRSTTCQTSDPLVPFVLRLGHNWPFPDWFLYSITVECAPPLPTSDVGTNSSDPMIHLKSWQLLVVCPITIWLGLLTWNGKLSHASPPKE